MNVEILFYSQKKDAELKKKKDTRGRAWNTDVLNVEKIIFDYEVILNLLRSFFGEVILKSLHKVKSKGHH